MSLYFVTGTDTGVGKTIVSAILTQAKQALYWKPIQCGSLQLTDSDLVRTLAPSARIHPEAYKLALGASPHLAAASENTAIDLDGLTQACPQSSPLIVEGSGGLMVPLNSRDLMLDLIEHLRLPVILVSRHYLGSINHTLLSVHALKSRNLPVAGLIFTGEAHTSTEQIICEHAQVKVLGRIPWASHVDKDFVMDQSRAGWLHELA